MTKPKRVKTCRWHKCGKSMPEAVGHQEYCSPDCRRRMVEWRRWRGSPLVTLMTKNLDDANFIRLALSARESLRAEVENDLCAARR